MDATVELPCYGEHGKHSGCPTCEYATYCRESADPPIKGGVQFELVDYAEEYATPSQVGQDETSNDIEQIFAELFARIDCRHQSRPMLRFLRQVVHHAIEHPRTMAVALAKIVSPHMSYAAIGARFGCDKQLISYHLKRANKLIPGINAAFLVDRRFNKRHNDTSLTASDDGGESVPNSTISTMTHLAIIRRSNRISLRCLAKRTGITYSLIAKYERGDVTPGAARLQLIKDALEEYI